jgi:hypothetical protein
MEMPAPNNHGFNVLGSESLVLSHIPMFMPPHQAQLFLSVTLEGTGGLNPTQAYLDDRKATGSTDYVLLSDPLVLPTLGPEAPQRLTSFTGKLYRGWPFNTPNTAPLIVPQLTVQVETSLYYHDITKGELLKDLTYLTFATSESAYLVHKLVQPPDLKQAPVPPDFCQILSAGAVSDVSGELHHVHDLVFAGVANTPANRLPAGRKVTGERCGKKATFETKAELIYDPNHLV